jgi:hypothetical protein
MLNGCWEGRIAISKKKKKKKKTAFFAGKGNAKLNNSKVGSSQVRGIILQQSNVEFNPTTQQ